MTGQQRGGNAGRWKTRKTKTRFLSFPPALGNRGCDFHIPTAPATTASFAANEPEKPSERSPSTAPTRFQPFRLILGLENAVRGDTE